MNVRTYDKPWLRQHFPELEERIQIGDIRISAKETGKDGECEISIWFPNTVIFFPDEVIMMKIRSLLFIGCPPKNIHYKGYGLVGIEVICSFPAMPPLPPWTLAYIAENPIPLLSSPSK